MGQTKERKKTRAWRTGDGQRRQRKYDEEQKSKHDDDDENGGGDDNRHEEETLGVCGWWGQEPAALPERMAPGTRARMIRGTKHGLTRMNGLTVAILGREANRRRVISTSHKRKKKTFKVPAASFCAVGSSLCGSLFVS